MIKLKAQLSTNPIHLLPTPQALSNAVAERVAALSAEAVARRGRFTVALSGGSMPALIGPPLITSPLRHRINWAAWRVFWADERCVPLTSPESNYRLAREHLLEHIPIPPEQIYPLAAHLAPAQAAQDYQAALAQVFEPEPGRLPRFDLILLGLGEDGHTASLFPGHHLPEQNDIWVAAVNNAPKPPPERITLTLPVLNNARQVIFLAAGAGKAEILARVLAGPPETLPARQIQPVGGAVAWFVDFAAARHLNLSQGDC